MGGRGQGGQKKQRAERGREEDAAEQQQQGRVGEVEPPGVVEQFARGPRPDYAAPPPP